MSYLLVLFSRKFIKETHGAAFFDGNWENRAHRGFDFDPVMCVYRSLVFIGVIYPALDRVLPNIFTLLGDIAAHLYFNVARYLHFHTHQRQGGCTSTSKSNATFLYTLYISKPRANVRLQRCAYRIS